MIRCALEDREIAVVGICEPDFEIGEILGHLGNLSEESEDLLAAFRKQVLDPRLGLAGRGSPAKTSSTLLP